MEPSVNHNHKNSRLDKPRQKAGVLPERTRRKIHDKAGAALQRVCHI